MADLKINRRWYDGAVLALWVVIAAAALTHHEPWADEASTWLIAHDQGWLRMVFSQLRYESNAGLWQSLIWAAIHWFHVGYGAMGWVGLAGATAGAAVLFFLAPFPRPLRYLIGFSFYFLYQYAVIARPYTFLPLLAFLCAWLYRRGERSVIPFTFTLILLAVVTVHGTLIAFALIVNYGWRRFRPLSWVVFSAAFVFLLIVLWPPLDSANVDDAHTFTFIQHLAKTYLDIDLAFSNLPILSLVIAACLYLWSVKRKVRSIFLIAVVGNALVFGFLRGAAHHTGILVVGAVTALWCGWPTPTEISALPPLALRWHRVTVAALCLLFAYQTTWAATAIRADWLHPYSGALDAAQYLKEIGADHQSIEGYDYLVVAIEPYFAPGIFRNLRPAPGVPFLHSFSREFRQRANITRHRPDSRWVVVGTSRPDDIPLLKTLMASYGYALMHTSDGIAVFHSAQLSEPQTYLIYRRTAEY